jgi:membrane-associated phospholipid phosphatase
MNILILLVFALTLTSGPAWSQALPDGPQPNSVVPPEPAVDPASTAAPKTEGQDMRDRVFYSDDTERVKPLARKFFVNLLLDQKDIVMSPFHMSGQDAIAWGLIGAGTGALIVTDRRSAAALPNTVDQISISKDVSNLGAVYTVLPITIGMYVGGAIAHNPKARETGVLGGEAIVDTLIDVEVLKVIFRRPRPYQDNGRGTFFAGGSSFPSGHAAESWALASVVAHEYNNNILIPIAAYGLASLVSFSRLSGQQHFGSDILFGGAMGWFTGRYVFKTHEDHSIHMHHKLSDLRPQVTPQFEPLSRTRGVALTWNLAP